MTTRTKRRLSTRCPMFMLSTIYAPMLAHNIYCVVPLPRRTRVPENTLALGSDTVSFFVIKFKIRHAVCMAPSRSTS
ncbi:hypothetical protein BDR03DRAFT_404040 [Suillus americanus]|nr:hypothetical protein BDR03DRAFT_404040 [Suillus americanus]